MDYYDTNNVFTWKQRHLWRVIPQSSAGTEKHVSFSDTETERWDDTLATSESEPPPYRPSTSSQQDRSTTIPSKNKGCRHRQYRKGRNNNQNVGGHAVGGAGDGGPEEYRRYPFRHQERKS